MILKLIFVAFPSAAAAPLKLFVCADVHGTSYLTADYRITCAGEEYEQYCALAFVGIAVYPIGCPLLYYCLLKANEDKLDDEKVNRQLGFIYDRYHRDYYWWEVTTNTD